MTVFFLTRSMPWCCASFYEAHAEVVLLFSEAHLHHGILFRKHPRRGCFLLTASNELTLSWLKVTYARSSRKGISLKS